jgi:hypothetical protein
MQRKTEWTFNDLANEPVFWKEKALDLLMTSKVLREAEESNEIEISGKKESVPFLRSHWPKIMIRAFAFECLVKALWLMKGNSLYVNEKYAGVGGDKGHRLSGMFEAAGMPAFGERKNLLDRLAAVAVAHGRYPFPTRKDFFNDFQPGKNGEFRIEWIVPEDDLLYFAIQKELMEKLQFEPEVIEFFRRA